MLWQNTIIIILGWKWGKRTLLWRMEAKRFTENLILCWKSLWSTYWPKHDQWAWAYICYVWEMLQKVALLCFWLKLELVLFNYQWVWSSALYNQHHRWKIWTFKKIRPHDQARLGYLLKQLIIESVNYEIDKGNFLWKFEWVSNCLKWIIENR